MVPWAASTKRAASCDCGVVTDGAGATKPGNTMAHPSTSIVTRMEFAATPARVWDGLMFYEQIDESPPLLLRLLLPRPIRTEGSKSAVDDEAICLYEGGHLVKRVTHVDACRHYRFKIVEQNLAVGAGLLLSGGCYALQQLPGGRTEVAVTTRYVSRKRPRWMWKPIEAIVCHLFHRHLLSAMRRKIESG
jgi:hypothetical protein